MGSFAKHLIAEQSYIENPRELRIKKRVTKNDKKNKQSIYSSKHIRFILKHLKGNNNNERESESLDREGLRPSKIGGVVKPTKNNAHCK
tara:strand:- start:19451 stop:19717 length:267 start_codon:yes stop_codon:yes gene_type:complete